MGHDSQVPQHRAVQHAYKLHSFANAIIQAHAGHMLDTCWTHAGHMLDTCWAHAGHMLDTPMRSLHGDFCGAGAGLGPLARAWPAAAPAGLAALAP